MHAEGLIGGDFIAGEFIAGDWGTSQLRLWLCAADGRVLDERRGPGAGELSRADYAPRFDALSAAWHPATAPLPTVLCGMVGSTLGWSEAGYADCPASPRQLATHATTLRAGAIRIIPGLACRNPLDAPDVMRGEETQILGAQLLQPALGRGQALLCLPGTHSKWVRLEDGVVRDFITAPTGELFALLCRHSVLAGTGGAPTATADEGFGLGVRQTLEHPGADPLHQLFQSRSRRLRGDLPADAAASFLSGLLIAHDCAGALRLYPQPADAPVYLIGGTGLATLYAHALTALGRGSVAIDGDAAVRAGLLHFHRLLATENR